MRFADVFLTAFTQIRANKLRSFFTLLGIIVSVAFLVAVIAIIQGLNAFVTENVANAMIGSNSFQVRRTPISFGLIEDEEWRRIQRRPKVTHADADVVRAALPDAEAISITSGWPTPVSDMVWRDNTLGDVQIFGVSPEHQVVQDYRFTSGEPLNDVDVRQRRNVVVVGADISTKLFSGVEAVGKTVRIRGALFTIVGVVAPKGKVLGQSLDGFAMMPITTFESMFGRRQTTTISVKMPAAADVQAGMARAEEAMRLAHRLRPGDPPDFTVETADALVSF